jgi:hypothetical protein
MATLKRKGEDNIIFDSLVGNDNDNEGDTPTIKLKGSTNTTEGGDEITLKKKEGKKRVKVETERLLGVDGIRRVYEEFPVICQFKGRGSEVCKLCIAIDLSSVSSLLLSNSFITLTVLYVVHIYIYHSQGKVLEQSDRKV